jgi:hypothetical protein
LVKDVEKNLMVFQETFFNLFIANQGRLKDLLEKSAQFGIMDPGVDRAIKGYLAEMRQLVELWCRMMGREDYARALGRTVGEATAQAILPESIKNKLKVFVRDLLALVAPDEIPNKLAELEEILSNK